MSSFRRSAPILRRSATRSRASSPIITICSTSRRPLTYETVKALSLEQFADRLGMGSNLQTKLLAGVPDLEASPDPDLLERAKTNLRRHFVTPIIVERFDESLMIVKDALGWGSVHYSKLLKNRNRTGMAPLPGRTVV